MFFVSICRAGILKSTVELRHWFVAAAKTGTAIAKREPRISKETAQNRTCKKSKAARGTARRLKKCRADRLQLSQAERVKHSRCDCACYAQVVVLLVTRNGRFSFVAKNSVDPAMIITELLKRGLNGTYHGVAGRC